MTQRHPFQSDRTMFVTTNVKNRKPLFSNDHYAREAIETLYRVQGLYPFFLYGFVIMPDHCHFLLRTVDPIKISDVMRVFKSGVSHTLGQGSLWQRGFHIRMPDNVQEVIRYIHLNPVRSSLVEMPEQYPWSSASGRWDVTSFGFESL